MSEHEGPLPGSAPEPSGTPASEAPDSTDDATRNPADATRNPADAPERKRTFTSRFGISREMTDEEVEALLARSWWGSLATVEDGGPYSVPVIYGWDGSDFYVASRGGRKVTNLQRDPSVCLTIVEAEGLGEPWYSVVVLGEATLVHGFGGHVKAIRALRAQVGRAGEIRKKDVAAMMAAKVIRISPREITGRIRIG
jgi:nitroimidazol reductase NimA-like FMN-containing flavoprotein (pyridoxamine 5'-phosphate oxidase superfamily)